MLKYCHQMKKTRGGAMPGAGAKKKADPKVQINLHIEQSIVDAIGDRGLVKEMCYNLLYTFKK